jgi:predicted phosphate transport protein (TIGR00153 family)
MRLQELVQRLLPNDSHFFVFLEKQAVAAHDGATALAVFKNEGARAEDVATMVLDVEHHGDSIVHQLEDALAKTFVTPIDREDLQKLSSQLDDILDLTNGAARAAVLYGVKRPTTAMCALMDKLVACTSVLKDQLPNLRKHAYSELIEAGRELRRLEKEADVIYRNAVRALFSDDAVDAKVILREKQVLEDLEKAIDRCEYVADTLVNLAVKNG